MDGRFTFGAEPSQLRHLLSMGHQRDPEQTRLAQTTHCLVDAPGTYINRYRLIRILAEGGMGIVYVAEQEHPFRRRVALKIIKPGMDSRRVIRRFEAERQALALLDHPNIAQVYDAGTTGTGRPYFVMELVNGLPITEYCDRHKLAIEDRLRLFQQVCHGVQHAHQKGIIHRDIKPSNILVSADDGEAIPKIIDFGVAKAVSQPLTERTLFTEDTHLLGTPEYMSPEQADMANEDIDTRSDIYSLGALLYVLLAGILPYDSTTFRQGGIEHIRKTIRQIDPKTPSTRLLKLQDEAKAVAENRSTEVATLAKRLQRELEWIPLKAMRKERSERYRSASELADDIDNYLNNNPLLAGPLGAVYRFKKLIRRHQALVVGMVALLIALVGGALVSSVFAVRAQHARNQTRIVADFLQNDILYPLSQASWNGERFEQVLTEAASKVDQKLANLSSVEVEIRDTLAVLFSGAGEYKLALEQRERANQIHLEETGGYYYANGLALSYARMGRYKEAEAVYLEVFNRRGRLDAQGRPVPHNRYPFDCCNLAGVYVGQGRYEEAEALLKKALASAQGWRPGSNWRLHYTGDLANVYREQGSYAEAEQLYITILEGQRDVMGEYHHQTVGTLDDLAVLRIIQGRYDEAGQILQELLSIRRSRWNSHHPKTLRCMNHLAVLRTRQSRYDDANDLFVEVLEASRRKLGDDHPATLAALNDFGVLRREQGQHEEAERLLNKAVNGRRRKLGPDHPACFESMHELALVYAARRSFDEAEPLLLQAYQGRETTLGPTHPDTIDSLRALVNLYESWDQPDKAAQWQVTQAQHNATNEQD